MNSLPVILFSAGLVLLELLYFRLARYFEILDHPNKRSLHERPTIRGGGIIFPLSVLLFFAITSRPDAEFVISLMLVSVIGFVDDVKSLGSGIRFFVQALAFGLVFYFIDFSEVPGWAVVAMFVVAVGAINTFNFMDGINGITGGYGLVALGTLLYLNLHHTHFTDNDFIEAVLISIAIFCFFNFRKKAVCFAGDVGSLSIGFIILYLIIKLIALTGNYSYALLLSVYGVDSILTIVHRLIRRENIFKPHKLHLFQMMVNHFHIQHVPMSMAYGVIQLVINVVVVSMLDSDVVFQLISAAGILFTLSLTYLLVKRRILTKAPL